MTRVLTTDAAPLREATDYWRDVICDTYVQLDCEPRLLDPKGPFFGEVRQNKISTIDVSTVNASPQHVLRTRSLVSRSSEDYFIVPIQTCGRSRAVQDGRCAELETGDFAIVDSTRPYELHYPEGLHLMTLKVPRTLLMAHTPNAEQLTAMCIPGGRGAGRLLFDVVSALLVNVGELETVAHDAVSTSIVELLGAGLRTLRRTPPAPPNALSRYHLERVLAHARRHLHDPGLSVQSTAAALQMSVSTLYRVFESQQQTLSEWIWCQRLDHCRRDLSDPELRHLAITQIAYRWGFSDSAHFSRAFKQAFGLRPRDFRQQAAGRTAGDHPPAGR